MAQSLANAAVTGSAYVLIAIGLTMVYGQLRILHVAHAAVYTFGGFVGLAVWQAGGGLWLALLAAAFACGVVGVGIFEGVYRPITDRSPIVPLIASVGLLILAQNLFEQDFFFGPRMVLFQPEGGLPPVSVPAVDLSLNSAQVTLLVVTVVLLAALLVVFRRTQLGLQWQALAEDADMANAVGIPVRWAMILNFFIGSALAGMGGVLVGLYDGRVAAAMGMVPSYKAFVVIVMGGIGSLWGAIGAGYLLALLETAIISRLGYILPRDAVAFGILILVLMFRPKGLFRRGG